MRLVIMGQAPFGAKVLETLCEQGREVIAAYGPPDKTGAKPDPLKEAARKRGIPVYEPSGYKAPETLQGFRELKPDLLVMAFVTDIVPPAFFAVPGRGAICYHPSLLPRHRGGSAINWTIIMGDAEAGLTVFWPDGGIDTGPLLLQKRTPVGPDDTTGSLYFDRLFPLGVEAVTEAVALIAQGKAPRTPQPGAGATYEPLCNDRVAQIDWGRPGPEIDRLIRGCDPQPGAFTLVRGQKLRLFEVHFTAAPETAAAGTILAVDDRGLHVTAAGGVVQVGKVRSAEGKMSARAFAEKAGLKAGDPLS